MGARISHWIKRVRETQAIEIDCSECLDQISQYVDLELSTGDASQSMPLVRQHLKQCQVCFEEYQVLRGLASLEMQDKLPTNEELLERLKRKSK